MRIIFTGGGSGGHVFPNMAIFEMLMAKGYCSPEDLLYIGTRSGFEQAILKDTSIAYAGITSGKLRRYASWQNFLDVVKAGLGIIQSYFIISRFKAITTSQGQDADQQ